MKKISKIFATVLTVALAMSTVVMPVSADSYANSVIDSRFTTDGVAGISGKDASDKIKAAPYRPRPDGYNGGRQLNSDVATYEAQLLPASGGELKIIIQNGATLNNNGRAGMIIKSNGTVSRYWEAPYGGLERFIAIEGVTADTTVWNKVAIEFDQVNDTIKWYLNGECVDTQINAGLGIDRMFNTDMNITGSGYIDNMRIYPAAYNPSNDIMPVSAGLLVLIADTMTVAEAKAVAIDTQGGSPAAVHIYKDSIYGIEAEDTETIQKGWKVVITSLSGDLYRANEIYTVSAALDCTAVTYADNAVTATVTNNAGINVPSMMMVLVEDGGKFVMSSEIVENFTTSATFTITGVDSLSNAEVFFVKSWSDLAPVMDATYEVE